MKVNWPFFVIATVTVWVVLSFVFKWPPIITVRQTSSGHACVNNLRQIVGAKGQWVHSAGKTIGEPVIVAEINRFIKGGDPVCPDGGAYSYNAIGMKPTCSLGSEPPTRIPVGIFRWEWSHNGKNHSL